MNQTFLPAVLSALCLCVASCATAGPRSEGSRPVDGWQPDSGLIADVSTPPVSTASGSDADASRAASVPERTTYRLRIEGMTCPKRCEREVKEMLAKVPGFVSAAVDVPTRTVTVAVQPGTDSQLLVAAIKTPYRARLV